MTWMLIAPIVYAERFTALHTSHPVIDRPTVTVSLCPVACSDRRSELQIARANRKLDAALITDRRHVYYFTGYWRPLSFASAVLIERDGPTTLVAPVPLEGHFAADEILIYESNRCCTLVDDQVGGSMDTLIDRLAKFTRIGIDGLLPAKLWHRPSSTWTERRPSRSPTTAVTSITSC